MIAARTGSLERGTIKKAKAIMKAPRGWRLFNTLIGIDSPLEAARPGSAATSNNSNQRLLAGKGYLFVTFAGWELGSSKWSYVVNMFHNGERKSVGVNAKQQLSFSSIAMQMKRKKKKNFSTPQARLSINAIRRKYHHLLVRHKKCTAVFFFFLSFPTIKLLKSNGWESRLMRASHEFRNLLTNVSFVPTCPFAARMGFCRPNGIFRQCRVGR